MSKTTKIQWADATFSPWRGCTKISPGCKNCYIYGTAPLRVAGQKSGDPRIRASESTWKQPLQWNDQANKAWEEVGFGLVKKRNRIFPSLMDWLDDEVPIEWLADFLQLVHDTPNLDWLLLTKRPENWQSRLLEATSLCATRAHCLDYVTAWLNGAVPSNIWLGVSVENQPMADQRIPELLKIPAKIRFLSVEPLLGPINIKDALRCDVPIHWVIIGGESGLGARPCNIEWIHDLIRQCRVTNVPCFVKQLGKFPCRLEEHMGIMVDTLPKLKDKKGGDMAEWPEDLRVRQFPDA